MPNEAGGVYDLVGRLLAGELSKRLGQSVFVENRPGGGSVTGTLAAATAAPDGHTLLMGGLSNIAFYPGLYEKLPDHPIRDFVPVGLAYTLPMRWLPAAACRNPAWRKLSKLLARLPTASASVHRAAAALRKFSARP